MNDLLLLSPYLRQALNVLVTAGSVLACLLILPTRFVGMELLGVGPNWLLIWVVAWSIKRSPWQGAIAGIALGFLQDGMTAANPTHTLSLALVGILTALIQKQRYIQEDFISVALIVFGMAVIAETVTAFQFMLQDLRMPDRLSSRTLSEIWNYHQQIALCSAILSSLWAPALYYPLNRWWQRVSLADQPQT